MVHQVDVDENAALSRIINLNISRSDGLLGSVEVSYATNVLPPGDLIAEAGADFEALDATVIFAEGEAQKTVTVTVLADDVPELDERLHVRITSVALVGAAQQPGSSLLAVGDNDLAVITVLENDDARGIIEIAATAVQVAEGDGVVTIAVERTAGLFGEVSFTWNASSGSAILGEDFVASGGTVVMVAGEAAAAFTVVITDDDKPEILESFQLTLTSASGGATIGLDDTTTVSISKNDDPHGVFGFAVRSAKVIALEVDQQNSSVTFTIERTRGLFGAVTVSWMLEATDVELTATDIGPFAGEVTFEEGQESAQFNLTVYHDDLPELVESGLLTLTGTVGGGALLSSRAVAVIDISASDHANGVLEFPIGVDEYRVKEEAGSFMVTVQRRGGSTGEVAVNFTTLDLSAKAGKGDYVSISRSLVFAEGEKSKTVEVFLLDDLLPENEERFLLVLSNPTGGAVLGLASTLVTETGAAAEAEAAATAAEAHAAVALAKAAGLVQAVDAAATQLQASVALQQKTSANLTAASAVKATEGALLTIAAEARDSANLALAIADATAEPIRSQRRTAEAAVATANATTTAAALALATTVARVVDFTAEPDIAFSQAFPSAETTEIYYAGLTITAVFQPPEQSATALPLSNRAALGFGVVGSACSGTCVSGFHKVTFSFDEAVTDLQLENTFVDQEAVTGPLTIEAFGLNGESLGVKEFVRAAPGENWYDIQAAFGGSGQSQVWVRKFILQAITSTVRVGAVGYTEVDGQTFEEATASLANALVLQKAKEDTLLLIDIDLVAAEIVVDAASILAANKTATFEIANLAYEATCLEVDTLAAEVEHLTIVVQNETALLSIAAAASSQANIDAGRTSSEALGKRALADELSAAVADAQKAAVCVNDEVSWPSMNTAVHQTLVPARATTTWIPLHTLPSPPRLSPCSPSHAAYTAKTFTPLHGTLHCCCRSASQASLLSSSPATTHLASSALSRMPW